MNFRAKSAFLSAMLMGGLLLAGCNQSPDPAPDPSASDDPADAEPSPSPDATPAETEPEPTEQVSILRPGFDPEGQAAAPKLEPLEVRILFPADADELTAAARKSLRGVLASRQFKTDGDIVLRAHSDAGGSDATNMRVSEERGEMVRDWLLDKGVEEERITLIAFGEQNPVEPNALPDGSPNEAGREANRRVEITISPPETPENAEPPTSANSPAERTDRPEG